MNKVMTVNEVLALLQTEVDWEAFFTMVQKEEHEGNRPSERFEKSRHLERALAFFSNGKIKYIDEQGRDLQCTESPLTFIEVKGRKPGWHKRSKARFRLVNGNSKDPERDYNHLPDDYAQYLFLFNLTHCFLVEKEIVAKYVEVDDSTNTEIVIDTNQLLFIASKTDHTNTDNITPWGIIKDDAELQYYAQFTSPR